jgi:hypothetical protein
MMVTQSFLPGFTMERKTIACIIVVIAVIGIFFLVWLHGYGISESQSTLHAYPIILNPDGSGTSSILEHVDKSLIGNATHLSEKDFSQYPAIAEVITGNRNADRGFSNFGGVANGDESVFAQKYYISEYEGKYYVLLVQLH